MKPFIITTAVIYGAGLVFGMSSAAYLWFDAPDKEQRKMAARIARGAPLWPIWLILTLIKPAKDDKKPVAEPGILGETTARIVRDPKITTCPCCAQKERKPWIRSSRPC